MADRNQQPEDQPLREQQLREQHIGARVADMLRRQFAARQGVMVVDPGAVDKMLVEK